MVHFLRTQENKTIIECEVTPRDLSSAVNLGNYSYILREKLNDMPPSSVSDFIEDFDTLDNIRGIWWENDSDGSMDDFVGEMYLNIARKYNLNYLTD